MRLSSSTSPVLLESRELAWAEALSVDLAECWRSMGAPPKPWANGHGTFSRCSSTANQAALASLSTDQLPIFRNAGIFCDAGINSCRMPITIPFLTSLAVTAAKDCIDALQTIPDVNRLRKILWVTLLQTGFSYALGRDFVHNACA